MEGRYGLLEKFLSRELTEIPPRYPPTKYEYLLKDGRWVGSKVREMRGKHLQMVEDLKVLI